MGVEVKLQAIPTDCELLKIAQLNYSAISWLWNFKRVKETGSNYPKYYPMTEERAQLDKLALQVINENPRIEERYFWGNRKHDQILYLLSPVRRGEVDKTEDDNLFNLAIHGEKKVHPKDYTYIVSPPTVELIAHFMQSVTIDEMQKHFDKEAMMQEVYKFRPDTSLDWIWSEFVEMRDVYVSAREHNEAMLTKID